jgi:DNA mismatch endonuclease, patch repair protein
VSDVFTPEKRRWIMSRVRGKNTTPELRVRAMLFARGYRYRLHRKDLPGIPDIVFPARRKAIFVHGCFWHGHDCPRGARIPAANRAYWVAKVGANVRRDQAHLEALERLGWAVLTVWECELKDPVVLLGRLTEFLG